MPYNNVSYSIIDSSTIEGIYANCHIILFIIFRYKIKFAWNKCSCFRDLGGILGCLAVFEEGVINLVVLAGFTLVGEIVVVRLFGGTNADFVGADTSVYLENVDSPFMAGFAITCNLVVERGLDGAMFLYFHAFFLSCIINKSLLAP